MRILVLGAYGLIGHAISTDLIDAGHGVIGLGRSARRGQALLPEADWLEADISTLTKADQWLPYLRGVDAVINAAGALQGGWRDHVTRLQADAITALIEACGADGPRRFIQISAPGADRQAKTEFLRSKGIADDTLMSSGLDWTIFRPGLVISETAYGGTSLLRSLTAIPLIEPILFPQTSIKTVYVRDVARAARLGVEGAAVGQDVDLVEKDAHTLPEIAQSIRRWAGFSQARARVVVPPAFGFAMARIGDLAGWLGWRTAFRTTSLRVLRDGVGGDPAPWQAISGAPLSDLQTTLKRLPATAQERLYARAQLVFPLLLIVLSAFWIASGLIGLWQRDSAANLLASSVPRGEAFLLVIAGSIVDIGIGLAVLMRPWVRWACLSAIVVSAGYLIAGTVLRPDYWADPLGAYVKILPAMGLALAIAAMAEER